MLGYPGSGKTTISEYIAGITGAVHLNSDQFRLHMFENPLGITDTEHTKMYNLLDYITSQILKSGKSVIYDANLNRYIHRKEKYDICAAIGAKAKLIWVKTPENIAKTRATIEAKMHPEHRPFGNMDKDVFDRLIKQIEPPHAGEKHIVLDGREINPDKIRAIV